MIFLLIVLYSACSTSTNATQKHTHASTHAQAEAHAPHASFMRHLKMVSCVGPLTEPKYNS